MSFGKILNTLTDTLTDKTLSLLEGIGKGVSKVVTAPVKIAKATPENLAVALGGNVAAEAATIKQAKQLMSGQRDTIDADMTAETFGAKLSDTFNSIDEGFHSGFKEIGDLTTADAPQFIPNRLKDIVKKFRNDDNTAEMKGVLNDIDSFLANDFPLDGANYTSLLRKIRRLTGDVNFKAGQKTVSGTKLLSDLNQDVRGLFLESAKRKSIETGDSGLLKKVKSLDKRFAEFQGLKSPTQPGHGDISNLRQLYVTLEDPVKTASLLKGIIGNKDLGVAKIGKLKAQLKELERVSGKKGLADDMFNNFKEVFTSKMFSKESGDAFKGYMKDNEGLKMLEQVWPEHKTLFRDWRYLFNKTDDHAAMGSWMTRVFGTAIGGTVGGQLGAKHGGPVAIAIGASSGAGLAASMFGSLLKSNWFQRFALKQFSKKPPTKKESLKLLGDGLEKLGFERSKAASVLDTFTGAAVVGSAGYAGKKYLEPTDAEREDDARAEINTMLEEDEMASERAKIEAMLAE